MHTRQAETKKLHIADAERSSLPLFHLAVTRPKLLFQYFLFTIPIKRIVIIFQALNVLIKTAVFYLRVSKMSN